MTKTRPRIKSLFWLVVIFLLLIIGSWFLASNRANARYQKLINNTELMTAFAESNVAEINRLTKQYNLYYQKIDNLAVSSSYGQNLPNPNFVGITHRPTLGLLVEKPEQSLKRLQPYRLFINYRLYIMLPLFPNRGTDGYLVYAKVVHF